MQKFSIILAISGFVLLLWQLIAFFDYSNPSWQNNQISYLGIISALLLIANGVVTFFHERKRIDK